MATFHHGGGAHFFQGASNVNIHGPVTATAYVQQNLDDLHLLDAEVAPNAILNAGGRADPVRCYPGTREEVISKIEKWMASGFLEDRRIFWLSGPAGAGKSAIVQTIAENCVRRNMRMANFFFFRADATRNHSRSVVATLVRQLNEIFPSLRLMINNIIASDRLIFKTPLLKQFVRLLIGPICSLRLNWSESPIILFIDGLDECDARSELDFATKSEQITLLKILHELVTLPDSPVIALVASRVESHIQMAFNDIGHANSSINLNDSDEYRPDLDIRRYITAELFRIKGTHPLGRLLDARWPSESTIHAIVEKSSGQFIYASTVARFTANSSQSPAISIEMVLNLRPVQKRSPFAEIDAIYMFILSRCEHWEFAAELLAVNAINIKVGYSRFPTSSLGYSEHEAASFFADLTPIIKATVADGEIEIDFYHASFEDFIYNPKRAGPFHIDLGGFASTLAPRLILGISDFVTFLIAADVLKQVDQRSMHLTHALTHLPPKTGRVDWGNVKDYVLPKVEELYGADEKELHRQIYKGLKHWADPCSMFPDK